MYPPRTPPPPAKNEFAGPFAPGVDRRVDSQGDEVTPGTRLPEAIEDGDALGTDRLVPLVHEAPHRLVCAEAALRPASRRHFRAASAQAMRPILIHRSRDGRLPRSRGGGR